MGLTNGDKYSAVKACVNEWGADVGVKGRSLAEKKARKEHESSVIQAQEFPESCGQTHSDIACK